MSIVDQIARDKAVHAIVQKMAVFHSRSPLPISSKYAVCPVTQSCAHLNRPMLAKADPTSRKKR